MKIDGKLSFMFYLNWKDQIDELDDQELRKLINNLISYHNGDEVILETKIDKLVWQGILPGLQANEAKYSRRGEANRENGKLGGAPKGNQNASKDKTTENNPEQPKQPDKREKINDNSKMEIENRKQTSDNREELNENTKLETEANKTKKETGNPYYAGGSSTISKSNSGMSMYEFSKQRGLL
jgi:hypothetical protein